MLRLAVKTREPLPIPRTVILLLMGWALLLIVSKKYLFDFCLLQCHPSDELTSVHHINPAESTNCRSVTAPNGVQSWHPNFVPHLKTKIRNLFVTRPIDAKADLRAFGFPRQNPGFTVIYNFVGLLLSFPTERSREQELHAKTTKFELLPKLAKVNLNLNQPLASSSTSSLNSFLL